MVDLVDASILLQGEPFVTLITCCNTVWADVSSGRRMMWPKMARLRSSMTSGRSTCFVVSLTESLIRKSYQLICKIRRCAFIWNACRNVIIFEFCTYNCASSVWHCSCSASIQLLKTFNTSYYFYMREVSLAQYLFNSSSFLEFLGLVVVPRNGTFGDNCSRFLWARRPSFFPTDDVKTLKWTRSTQWRMHCVKRCRCCGMVVCL